MGQYDSDELKYIASIKANDLDTSEYILLTLALLDKKSTELQNKKDIKQIYQLYLDNNYEKAKSLIEVLLKEISIDPALVDVAMEKSKTLVDNPNKNDSRRYFETRFAGYYADNLAEKNYHKSVVPLLNAFNDEIRQFESSEKLKKRCPNSIDDYNDARRLIMLSFLFNDIPEAVELKKASVSYSDKDRADKESGIAYNKKGEKLEPLTSNPGIMKSTAPNFPDQLLKQPEKIRAQDGYKLDEKKSGFASKHQEIPMVGNASGSIFGLTILLKNMMEKNKDSPTLERDVNNIIKIFSVEYIKAGFHSLHEMMEILKEPALQTVFDKYNVNLELSFLEEELEKEMGLVGGVESKAGSTINDDKVAQGLFNYVKSVAPEISGKIKAIEVRGEQLVISIASAANEGARIADKATVRDQFFNNSLGVPPINVKGQFYFLVNIADVRAKSELMNTIAPEAPKNNDGALKKAMIDSQNYAMQLAMKRRVHEELKNEDRSALKHVTPRVVTSLNEMGIVGGLQPKAELAATPIPATDILKKVRGYVQVHPAEYNGQYLSNNQYALRVSVNQPNSLVIVVRTKDKLHKSQIPLENLTQVHDKASLIKAIEKAHPGLTHMVCIDQTSVNKSKLMRQEISEARNSEARSSEARSSEVRDNDEEQPNKEKGFRG